MIAFVTVNVDYVVTLHIHSSIAMITIIIITLYTIVLSFEKLYRPFFRVLWFPTLNKIISRMNIPIK